MGQIYGPGNGSHLTALLETHPVFVKHGVANLTLFYQGANGCGGVIEIVSTNANVPADAGPE